MKEEIVKILERVTGEKVVVLETPANPEFGDYTTNIALQLAGRMKELQGKDLWKTQGLKKTGKKNKLGDEFIKAKGDPRDISERIVQELVKDEQLMDIVDEVVIAGPGFINFFLKKDKLLDTLSYVFSHKDTHGYTSSLKDKKIVVEYTDPNPFKEFHVGHLYSNTVGESIARLFESQGATVWRADYFGDVGMHVAKAIWGLLEKFKTEKTSLNDLKKKDLKERIEYFGQAYSKGATAYEENKEAVEDMKILNFLIFKAAQDVVLPTFSENPQVNYDQYIKKSKYSYDEIKDIYTTGRTWSMEYFETIYKRVGMKFDGYYPESRTGEFGYGMVLDGLEKGIFEKGEGGAVIFPGEKYGLHNRVFINSMNLPTYETKDFGNAVVKYKDFPYDKSVIVTGNEINEYFVVVLKALLMYKKTLSEATTHIGHGIVLMADRSKMSSRTGKIIRGEWILDEAKKRVIEIINKAEGFKNSSEEEKGSAAENVAQGAVKYAFLKQGIGNNIAFDFKTSLSFEGNSGPYLQYTYARAKSVLGKVKDKKPEAYDFSGLNQKLNNEELAILRTLIHFPEVVADAAQKYSPNLICNYLFDLAQKFNFFYGTHRVLGEGDDEVESFRLNLTFAVSQVIKNGLKLLGIKAPEKM